MRKSSVQIAIIALMCCFAFVSCDRTEQIDNALVMPMTEETTELIAEEPALPTIEESLNPLFEEYEPEPVEEIIVKPKNKETDS